MTAPHVSTIIPCFVATESQAALLDETLATVSSQTCTAFEAIAVDE